MIKVSVFENHFIAQISILNSYLHHKGCDFPFVMEKLEQVTIRVIKNISSLTFQIPSGKYITRTSGISSSF